MSAVVLNEGAIEKFFHDPASRLGRLIESKAKEIHTVAVQHATANIRSGLMMERLMDTPAGPLQDKDGVYWVVGSDATKPWKGHEPFNYPIALEKGGYTPQGIFYQYPFLDPALRAAGFRPPANI